MEIVLKNLRMLRKYGELIAGEHMGERFSFRVEKSPKNPNKVLIIFKASKRFVINKTREKMAEEKKSNEDVA